MTLKKRVIIASPPCAIILRMLCLELSWKILEVFLSGFRSSYVPSNVSLEFMRINYKWEVYFYYHGFQSGKQYFKPMTRLIIKDMYVGPEPIGILFAGTCKLLRLWFILQVQLPEVRTIRKEKRKKKLSVFILCLTMLFTVEGWR